MADWRTSQLQRETIDAQRTVAALDTTIASLEATLDEARGLQSEYQERRRVLESRMHEVRTARYQHLTSDAAGYPLSGVPSAAVAEYARLRQAWENLEHEQRREVDARRIPARDAAGFDVSWSPLDALAVELRLQRTRTFRAVAAGRLVELEAQLTLGERCQVGTEAPELAEHAARVAAGRERLGLPASA